MTDWLTLVQGQPIGTIYCTVLTLTDGSSTVGTVCRKTSPNRWLVVGEHRHQWSDNAIAGELGYTRSIWGFS